MKEAKVEDTGMSLHEKHSSLYSGTVRKPWTTHWNQREMYYLKKKHPILDIIDQADYG